MNSGDPGTGAPAIKRPAFFESARAATSAAVLEGNVCALLLCRVVTKSATTPLVGTPASKLRLYQFRLYQSWLYHFWLSSSSRLRECPLSAPQVVGATAASAAEAEASGADSVPRADAGCLQDSTKAAPKGFRYFSQRQVLCASKMASTNTDNKKIMVMALMTLVMLIQKMIYGTMQSMMNF